MAGMHELYVYMLKRMYELRCKVVQTNEHPVKGRFMARQDDAFMAAESIFFSSFL